MTKKELVAAIADFSDDAEVQFYTWDETTKDCFTGPVTAAERFSDEQDEDFILLACKIEMG
jgi:hypothetical protein